MAQGKIEVVLKNCFNTIGEGPHWDHVSQTLWCVDIFCGGVHRFHPETLQHSQMNLDGTTGFVIPKDSGGHIVGLNKSLVHLDFNSKTVSSLAEVDPGTMNRFNDAKCDRVGRLWAGTTGHEDPPGQPIYGLGTLYSVGRDHKPVPHLNKLDISNGMDWTSDDAVMYFIDSQAYNVVAFDYDISKGTISNQREVAVISDHSMVPDGMCIDENGKIWVACFDGSRVIRFDPETGKTLQTLMFPASKITSCCFGGKNLDELYVTSAKKGVSAEDLKTKQPLAGSLFKVTELGVKGKPANNFAG